MIKSNGACFYNDKMEDDEIGSHVTCIVETSSAYELLVKKKKPEGKRPLGRTKMDLKETG
jgi:hypothetical protein